MIAHRLKPLLPALLALLVAACGGEPPLENGNGEAPNGNEVDTTPPTLVSVSPEDGATGVRSDASVILVFSEAMDQASVEGTLDTSDLGQVTFSWNEAGDTLTITPDEPLAYAQGAGTNPGAVEAESYSVTLGSAARDLAGNDFGTGFRVDFSTLKEMAHTFEVDDSLTDTITRHMAFQSVELGVGDDNQDGGVRALITFDMALLPFATVEVAMATLATRQLIQNMAGAPFGDAEEEKEAIGDAVLIDHVTFSALDETGFDASETAHAHLGEFCEADQVIIEKDVTVAVEDDRIHRDARGALSQFMLRFERESNGDGEFDMVVFSLQLTELQVVYLAP